MVSALEWQMIIERLYRKEPIIIF